MSRLARMFRLSNEQLQNCPQATTFRIWKIRIEVDQLPRTEQSCSKKDCVLFFFNHGNLPLD